MPVLSFVLLALAGLVVVATVLPLVRAPYWWVRMFDFPRAQLAVVGVIVLGLYAGLVVILGEPSVLEWWVLAALVVAVGYQVARMRPYTPFASVQTLDAGVVAEGRTLRLLISNVLMENREGERWLGTVREADPDVVVAVETDQWWADTAGALKDTHPHAIEIPQDDTYGMCVYSRLPFQRTEVRHLVEQEVPSLFLTAELPSGEAVKLVFLHPRPPRPDIQQDSTLRDAELVLAARDIATFERPVIVAGDLNDVAWSYTTTLFQKLADLLDPRIGRGLFATFHADHWWLRYPLDHVFHSDDLTLIGLQRLGNVGSDHFPMLIELAVDPSRRPLQESPDAEATDADQAEEMVEDAAKFKADESAEEKAERVEEDV